MKTHTLLGAVAFALMLTLVADAQVPESSQGFNAFRLVRTRNIFDPDRRAERSETRTARTQTTTSRSNFVALTGTMVTESKSLAFFTGSQSDHSKVIAVGDRIADFTVKAITATQVDLDQAGKTTVLAIGRQLTLAGFIVESASLAPGAPSGDAPPANAGATSPPAPTGDKSDLLRRMMERRQKETSK